MMLYRSGGAVQRGECKLFFFWHGFDGLQRWLCGRVIYIKTGEVRKLTVVRWVLSSIVADGGKFAVPACYSYMESFFLVR